MERAEVSEHEVRVYASLRRSGAWLSNKEVAELARVAQRTARLHTKRLVDLGLLELAEVFPSHRFRAFHLKSDDGHEHLQRIVRAAEVLGISIPGVTCKWCDGTGLMWPGSGSFGGKVTCVLCAPISGEPRG